LQWAIETFENGRVKDVDQAKRLREYNISLLRHHSKYVVKSIQRGDTQSIVVPESLETAHRMDHDELLDLIGGTRKDGEMHEYLLAVAAALIDNGDSLPAPLKEFVVEFLRNPKMPRPGRGRKRSTLLMRDQFIAFVVASICVRWDFSPNQE